MAKRMTREQKIAAENARIAADMAAAEAQHNLELAEQNEFTNAVNALPAISATKTVVAAPATTLADVAKLTVTDSGTTITGMGDVVPTDVVKLVENALSSKQSVAPTTVVSNKSGVVVNDDSAMFAGLLTTLTAQVNALTEQFDIELDEHARWTAVLSNYNNLKSRIDAMRNKWREETKPLLDMINKREEEAKSFSTYLVPSQIAEIKRIKHLIGKEAEDEAVKPLTMELDALKEEYQMAVEYFSMIKNRSDAWKANPANPANIVAAQPARKPGTILVPAPKK